MKTGNRITPAYAGKSYGSPGAGIPLKDHPRIRGEKQKMACKELLLMGSPPHTRGKVFNNYDNFSINRITPAYAGKSLLSGKLFPASWDHPRIRGEKHRAIATQKGKEGSPPHTRGKGR